MLQIIKNISLLTIVFCVIGVDVHGMQQLQTILHRKQENMIRQEWSQAGGNKIEESEKQPQTTYTLAAAGVLPIIYDNQRRNIRVIVGRQSDRDRVNAGKYDYFAGIADKEDGGDSVATAAREWHEESRLGQILAWSERNTRQFVRDHVKGYIILATRWKDNGKGNTYGVMYLVDIGQDDICQKLFEGFESSYQDIMQKEKDGEIGWSAFLEKDKLIEVGWNDLFKSVDLKNPQQLKSLKFSGERENKTIELRDIFAFLLRGIDGRNRLLSNKELQVQFPLGIFVFGSQQLDAYKRSFGDLELSQTEKIDLNAEVMLHLQNREVAEETEVVEQVSEAPSGQTNVSELSNIVQAARQKSEEKKRLRQAQKSQQPEPTPEEQQKQLTPEELQALAKIVATRQETKNITSPVPEQKTQTLSNEQQNQQLHNSVAQENSGFFAAIGTVIWSGVTRFASLLGDFLSWIGGAFQ